MHLWQCNLATLKKKFWKHTQKSRDILNWRWTNFTVVREVLHNNHWSHNLAIFTTFGHDFTRLFLTRNCTQAGHKTRKLHASYTSIIFCCPCIFQTAVHDNFVSLVLQTKWWVVVKIQTWISLDDVNHPSPRIYLMGALESTHHFFLYYKFNTFVLNLFLMHTHAGYTPVSYISHYHFNNKTSHAQYHERESMLFW